MGRSPSGRQRSVHEKLLAAIARGERPKFLCDEISTTLLLPKRSRGAPRTQRASGLATGIFHWAGSETLSRFEMGQRIFGTLICPRKYRIRMP